jgi:hypothetical protein
MDSFGDAPRHVDVGFSGGGSVTLRLREAGYKSLRDELRSDRAERWHELDADGAEALIDLSQVVYVRLDTQEKRAGFRGA